MGDGSIFKTTWQFGDKAIIDGDESIKATVVGIGFKRDAPCELYLAWFSNGAPQDAWFPDWRLTKVAT